MDPTETTPRYYFKRKRYGWGWTPVTWLGWLIIVIFLVPIFWAVSSLPPQPTEGQLTKFLLVVAISILLMLIIVRRYGPAPRWRWGKRSSDNPEEDF